MKTERPPRLYCEVCNSSKSTLRTHVVFSDNEIALVYFCDECHRDYKAGGSQLPIVKRPRSPLSWGYGVCGRRGDEAWWKCYDPADPAAPNADALRQRLYVGAAGLLTKPAASPPLNACPAHSPAPGSAACTVWPRFGRRPQWPGRSQSHRSSW